MTETIPPPSGQGTVVLNLGPGTGALVLYAPPELDGHEIEISRPGARTHSRIRERRTGGSVRYAAVYPDLPAADYTIWRDPVTPAGTVTVAGGQVTSYHLGLGQTLGLPARTSPNAGRPTICPS